MVMVIVFLLVHPLEPVPVTVYVVVTLGFTKMLEAVSPVLHEYVFAPVAVRALPPVPTQCNVSLAVTVTVGVMR
jgi:hypothetical protein